MKYKNKINERKIWFLEKHQQIDKSLVRLTRKRKREDSNTKIGGEREIITDLTEIKISKGKL